MGVPEEQDHRQLEGAVAEGGGVIGDVVCVVTSLVGFPPTITSFAIVLHRPT